MWSVASTLLLVVGGVTVSPPQDLTVTCHNLQVVASWGHAEMEPGTSFVVTMIRSSTAEESVVTRTRERSLNLSGYITGSLDKLLGTYKVMVAAQRGGISSQNRSEMFSFNQLKPHECTLDFPPVIVSIQEQQLVVRFPNPLDFYEPLRTAEDGNLAVMECDMDSAGAHFNWTCVKEQKECSISVHSSDSCVMLTKGYLFKNRHHPSTSFRFRDSARTCAEDSAEHLTMCLVISIATLVVIMIVLTLVICKVKAWTLVPTQLPKALTTGGIPSPGCPDQPLPDPPYDLVQTIPASLKARPDMCPPDPVSEEERQAEEDWPLCPSAERRGNLGDGEPVMVYSELRRVPASDPTLHATSCSTATPSSLLVDDDDPRATCEYTEGLESEVEGAVSSYDRPHCPVVDPALS